MYAAVIPINDASPCQWAEEPKKRENFYRWLEQARRDFGLYLNANRFDAVPEELKRHLGSGLVDRTLRAVLAAAPVTISTGGDDCRARAEAAINEIRRTGAQSKPWTRS